MRGRHDERRVALAVDEVDRGARLDQPHGDGEIAVLSGEDQRRLALDHRVRVRALVEQLQRGRGAVLILQRREEARRQRGVGGLSPLRIRHCVERKRKVSVEAKREVSLRVFHPYSRREGR